MQSRVTAVEAFNHDVRSGCYDRAEDHKRLEIPRNLQIAYRYLQASASVLKGVAFLLRYNKTNIILG
jgi:hypothetical protein